MASKKYLDYNGLDYFWDKIKNAINEANQPEDAVVVTITSTTVDDVTTYSADKTYSELRSAHVNGKTVVLRYSNMVWHTHMAPNNTTGTTPFYFGTLTGGASYYWIIRSSDEVERPTLRTVTSVNGQTGAVTLKTSDLTNDSGFITTNTTYSLSMSSNVITLTGSDSSTSSVTTSQTMVVNITWDTNEEAHVADKTTLEIYNWVASGGNVVAKYNGAYMPMCYEPSSDYAYFSYYAAYEDSETHILGYETYNTRISSTGLVEIVQSYGTYVDLATYSDGTPSALGVASRGDSFNAAKADHVHPLPTLSMSGNTITLTGAAGSTSSITLPVYNGSVTTS